MCFVMILWKRSKVFSSCCRTVTSKTAYLQLKAPAEPRFGCLVGDGSLTLPPGQCLSLSCTLVGFAVVTSKPDSLPTAQGPGPAAVQPLALPLPALSQARSQPGLVLPPLLLRMEQNCFSYSCLFVAVKLVKLLEAALCSQSCFHSGISFL